ncbi:MAG: hypothetical protein LBJ70_02490 [Holosporales bacterium]|nr:hypothetical protein [Holosporales bacterium]
MDDRGDLAPLFTETTCALMCKFRKEGSCLRVVGGAVRDCLRGDAPADIDFCTPALPDAVSLWIQQMGWRALPTGVLFGTITARAPTGEMFEITTLRRDLRSDGRYASVEFTSSWFEDAARRDFTINALSCDENGALYDFFDGLQDLQEGRVHFIGDPQDRIEEDHLRILRYFRFWARFGHVAPEPNLLKLLESSALLLESLSGERLWKELLGILATARFGEAFWLMNRILGPILGIVFPKPLSRAFWEHPLLRNPLLRLSIGLPSEASYRLACRRLHLSKVEAKHLGIFLSREPYDVQVREERLQRVLLQCPQGGCAERLAADIVHAVLRKQLAEEEALDLLNDVAQTVFPVFPLTGSLLLAAGMPPGASMGEILEKTHRWWAANNGEPDQAACLAMALQVAGIGA